MADKTRSTQSNEIAALADEPITRRDFIKTSALVGGAIAVTGGASSVVNHLLETNGLFPETAQAAGEYPLNKPENILYTACLQCNTGCSIKTKLIDGVIAKIDGSPFGPMTFWPHLPYETSPL